MIPYIFNCLNFDIIEPKALPTTSLKFFAQVSNVKNPKIFLDIDNQLDLSLNRLS